MKISMGVFAVVSAPWFAMTSGAVVGESVPVLPSITRPIAVAAGPRATTLDAAARTLPAVLKPGASEEGFVREGQQLDAAYDRRAKAQDVAAAVAADVSEPASKNGASALSVARPRSLSARSAGAIPLGLIKPGLAGAALLGGFLAAHAHGVAVGLLALALTAFVAQGVAAYKRFPLFLYEVSRGIHIGESFVFGGLTLALLLTALLYPTGLEGAFIVTSTLGIFAGLCFFIASIPEDDIAACLFPILVGLLSILPAAYLLGVH